jgi:hypothetical protein
MLPGCASYVLRTADGPAHDVPDKMYGLGPGVTSRDALKKSGWALSDSREASEMYVLGAPVQGVQDVEAQVTTGADGARSVQFIRLRYARTRLATYRELIQKLLSSYGAPQSSMEVSHFDLFEQDPNSDAPRPPSFVVHRWRGRSTELVLAAGLEATENLAENMQYQLFLMPADADPRAYAGP